MNEENINEVKNILSILKRTSFVISKKDTFNKIFSESHLKIDQPIYFYKEDTQEVYEKYNINDRIITRKLGKATANGFEWMNSVSSNFIKRRSDFHGLILKGMTDFEGTDMRADDSYLTSASYFAGIYTFYHSFKRKTLHISVTILNTTIFSENDTYLVNGYTSGLFQDVLDVLESQLNFSTLLYKRKTTFWGSFYNHPNGTVYGTGMMGDIFYKNADLTVAPMGVTFVRGSFVGFLPIVKQFYMELYISKDSQAHAMDFHLLLSPFAQDSWISIIFASLIIALVKLWILKLHGNIYQF